MINNKLETDLYFTNKRVSALYEEVEKLKQRLNDMQTQPVVPAYPFQPVYPYTTCKTVGPAEC